MRILEVPAKMTVMFVPFSFKRENHNEVILTPLFCNGGGLKQGILPNIKRHSDVIFTNDPCLKIWPRIALFISSFRARYFKCEVQKSE